MVTNGINPSIAMWVNVVFLVLTGIAAGSVAFPPHDMKTALSLAAFIISCINTVFHMFSSPTPGPAVSPPLPMPKPPEGGGS